MAVWPGSRSGGAAVVQDLVTILRTHLQDYLDDVSAELGISPAVAAPEDADVIGSRLFRLVAAPAVLVYLERSELIEELHVRGSSRRQRHTIRVLCRVGDEPDRMVDATDVELRLAAMVQAAQTCVLDRWRADQRAATCIQDIRVTQSYASLSTREQDRVEGTTTRGQALSRILDEAAADLEIIQAVHAPVTT